MSVPEPLFYTWLENYMGPGDQSHETGPCSLLSPELALPHTRSPSLCSKYPGDTPPPLLPTYNQLGIRLLVGNIANVGGDLGIIYHL